MLSAGDRPESRILYLGGCAAAAGAALCYRMKTIVLTGGGTAGHVTPNLAIIPLLRAEGWNIHYIGTEGIEKRLISQAEGVSYHTITSGKLRRYFDLKNLSDPFKVLKGISQSKKLLKEIKPDLVFSKGGYVAVPVVLAAKSRKIPTVIHESDMTPGLATKLSAGAAKKICVTFEAAGRSFDRAKVAVTGSPIRAELLEGSAQRAKSALGFDDKPVVLFMGGSSGARVINEALRAVLNEMLKRYNIIHLCGAGNVEPGLDRGGYVQSEYADRELADYLALADMVVSRAGSNSINEFLTLCKPMLLIPLSKNASRGDQVDNAEDFKKHGYCDVLLQEDMNPQSLINAVDSVYNNREVYRRNMRASKSGKGTENIMRVIREVAGCDEKDKRNADT